MDYASIINLILVTIIYSTFIAPGLNRLGVLRDEIAEIQFPRRNSPQNRDEMEAAGEALQSKLNLYGSKWRELKRFLQYFYFIIILLIYIQLGTLWYRFFFNQKITSESILTLLTVSLIVLLLSKAIRSYMVPPHKVRSIQWLANQARVKPIYYRQLLGAKLVARTNLTDVAASTFTTEIILSLANLFLGYRYLVTVESQDHDKLYYIAGGPIERNAYWTSYYSDASITHQISLGVIELKPGTYQVRLLIFESPFMNKDVITSETIQELAIDGQSQKLEVARKIDLVRKTAKYVTFEGQGVRVRNVRCSELSKSEENTVRILSVNSFVRLFKNSTGTFDFKNLNGHIDKHEILKATERSRIWLSRLRKFVTRDKVLHLN